MTIINLMRHVIFFVFIFGVTRSIAQNAFPEDKTIITLYSDTVTDINLNNIYSKQITDSNHYTYLVKVRASYLAVFKKQFKIEIRRQLNANWFIVRAEGSTIRNNIFIEQYFIANNNWKLSPTLVNKLDELPLNKDFIFLVEVSDSSSFDNFINQHATQASILSTHSNGNIFRVRTSFSFIRITLLVDENILFVDLKLNTPKEETVVNDYDN